MAAQRPQLGEQGIQQSPGAAISQERLSHVTDSMAHGSLTGLVTSASQESLGIQQSVVLMLYKDSSGS